MSTDIEKRWNCYMFNEEIIFARTSEQAKLAWCEWFDRAWPGGEPQQVENWMDYGSTQSLPGSRPDSKRDPIPLLSKAVRMIDTFKEGNTMVAARGCFRARQRQRGTLVVNRGKRRDTAKACIGKAYHAPKQVGIEALW